MASNDNPDTISPAMPFRVAILGMMLYTDWLDRYGCILKPEYFPTGDEQAVVTWVNQYYSTYKAIPSDIAVMDGLNDNPLLDDVLDVTDEDAEYAADMALEFARSQAMKIAILESVDDVRDGDYVRIRERVEDALRVGVDRLNLGWDLIDDADDWLYDELHGRRYPTGWPTIDKLLKGGLVPGEYGLIMAPTGRGKTTALVNIGYAMAGLMGAANVLHVTLEMPKQKVLKRYGVRMVGSQPARGGDAGFKRQLVELAKKRLRAHVRVAEPEDRSIEAIRRLIDNLRSTGFHPDALIVDYADRLTPTRRRKEYRFELADITQELRDFGSALGIPVWSATQARREAFYKEVITLADIAEAIEKATISDVILAICQTRDEEQLGQGRLFGAKVRDAPAGFSVDVKVDFGRQLIAERSRSNVQV